MANEGDGVRGPIRETGLSEIQRAELGRASIGLGLAQHHRGNDEAAVELLKSAHDAAVRAGDRPTHWACLMHLARVELARGRAKDALSYCEAAQRITNVGEGKIGEGEESDESEGDAAIDSLASLARMKLGERDAKGAVERAIVRLRAIDARVDLTYALCELAEWELATDRYEAARPRALEAVGTAESVGRRNDVARAHIILARIALATHDTTGARAEIDAVHADLAKPMEVADRVRATAAAVVAAVVAIEQNM